MAYVGTTSSQHYGSESLWSRISAWSKMAFARLIKARELEARQRIIAIYGKVPEFLD